MIHLKSMSSRVPAHLCRLSVLALLASVAGCGGGDDGPERFKLSGTVTYDGKPVPTGFVTLIPDIAAGNSGPGGGAAIINGRFETSDGKGSVGGPHRIRIVGYSGIPTHMEGEDLPDGVPLFPQFETTATLPKQYSEHNFEIPKFDGDIGQSAETNDSGHNGSAASSP